VANGADSRTVNLSPLGISDAGPEKPVVTLLAFRPNLWFAKLLR
jgi:hypothetical protein